MLPSRSRLTRAQFEQLLATPNLGVAFNRLGTLKYLKIGKKLAIVVSSKHEKRAVYRNKLRRRLYSLFRISGSQIQAVLYVSKGVYNAEYSELQSLFNDLLAKASK